MRGTLRLWRYLIWRDLIHRHSLGFRYRDGGIYCEKCGRRLNVG